MPSMEETKRKVKASLQEQQPVDDHDAILASLQDEIDRHNRDNDEESRERGQRHGRRHRNHDKESQPGPSVKFRFKSGVEPPRKRKHKSRDHESRHHRKSRRERHEYGVGEDEEAAHPFPREPTNPDQDKQADPNAAFRESLFDALADDEGAAYWEHVYSQPIHVYPRPHVETAKGELEQMNDDEYAAYVQAKMWEKKNPHIVLERERNERQKREEEEEKTRQREEFIRRKERAAWERAQTHEARKSAGAEDNEYEYVFDCEDRKQSASKRSWDKSSQIAYRKAWQEYSAAWDKLKMDLLIGRHAESTDDGPALPVSKRIPWPVPSSKPVTRPNIEEFMRQMPVGEGRTKVQLLKAERVRWHPDKIQQRFGGHVDEGTMKLVTGIFQIIDALLQDAK